MKRKEFIAAQILVPIMFIASYLIWYTLIRKYTFIASIKSSLELVCLYYLILNILISINNKNIDISK